MKTAVSATALALPLRHAAKITRGTQTESCTVIVRATSDGLEGIGECAPIPRYDETVETVLNYYAHALSEPLEVRGFDNVLSGIPRGARCGIDIALYDLLGKRLDAPLWEIFGLDPDRVPETSFTIYIDDVATMVEEAKEHRHAPILKVKLGLGNEIETIQAIRSFYCGRIRIDANEGWTPEQAVRTLRELERYDVEFCEQPIPAHNVDQLRWVRARTRIPIVADEDSVIAEDIPQLAGVVDGVNVKLAKCGGMRTALEMIHVARAVGLRVMLGCMTETSILITAAAHLAPLADWVDLDGNLLLEHEPFSGVLHNAGRLSLPGRPGLGILEMAAA